MLASYVKCFMYTIELIKPGVHELDKLFAAMPIEGVRSFVFVGGGFQSSEKLSIIPTV